MTDCHVEIFSTGHTVSWKKCLHMVNMEKICHVEKFLHMRNVETNLVGHNLCYFVAKSCFFASTLFCRKIYFVAIHALLRGEKLNQKLCLWRKKDKYEVCYEYECIASRQNQSQQSSCSAGIVQPVGKWCRVRK